MMRSLWTAATGMVAQQLNIDVISHNLANVNTTGFKKSRAEFEDLIYQNMRIAGTVTGADAGQTIVIDKSTLLGRKPSMDVPQGAKAVRIVDPTRTTSRNHAAISIDTDGALWIEDYGSLNGTYIITNGQETQVTKGTPLKLSAPATVRIGDQFFQFTEKQA